MQEVTVYNPTTTGREKKPLKLNVTNRTIGRLVALKLSNGHHTLSETLVYLLDREEASENR
jgi:hypothetical protein